jgi:peroxiredoxin Q/BCP
VLGVSADSQKSHQKFIEKHNLPFPLIADTEKVIIKAFGVWGPKKFMGKTFDGIHRTTFIIDEQGVIEEIIDKVKTKEHASQIVK